MTLRLQKVSLKAGQLSIRWIEKKINQYLNKLLKTDKDFVIASDTDSIYVTFDALIDASQTKQSYRLP